MKQLGLVLVLSLLISMVLYGTDYWYSCKPYAIQYGYDVGIGRCPDYKLDVNGTIRMSGFRLSTGATSGYVLTCGSGGVGTWQPASGGSVWSTNGSKIYYNAGNVGIGTSNPQVKLHIAGSIRGNQSGALRISTGYGYVDVGPKNSSYAHFYTDRARFYFDKEIRVNGGSIGSYNGNLQLQANGTTRMTILDDNGNVGIGTTSPGEELEVAGTIKMSGFKLATDAADGYVLTSNSSGVGTWQPVSGGSLWSESGSDVYYNAGNVGIGTTSPGEELDVAGTVKTDSFKLPTGATNNYVLTSDANGVGTWQSIPLQWSESGDDIYYNTGNVCIGTDIPESELTVDGTITTREMKVQLTGWPDFVFEDNYKLIPLNALEKHIKKQKSLPGIPTNKEVIKEGVLVGKMQAKLLEKVEELTLYVIELNKEVENLREENEDLKLIISAVAK